MSVLLNAARVLRCIGSDCPDLTVSEVARRLDMPKANASRLLKAMREAGMLETIGDSHRHRPGSLMLYVASLHRHSSALMGVASEAVAKLSATFGHTAYVTLRDGREVVGVAVFEGSNALRVVSNIGRRLPAHLSATGQTLLARLPDEQVQSLYQGHPDASSLQQKLTQVRQRGYALSSQESTPGVDAIAIAVCDPSTSETLSLCIVYPHAQIDAAGRDQMTAALAEQACKIATQFGDTQFVSPLI